VHSTNGYFEIARGKAGIEETIKNDVRISTVQYYKKTPAWKLSHISLSISQQIGVERSFFF